MKDPKDILKEFVSDPDDSMIEKFKQINNAYNGEGSVSKQFLYDFLNELFGSASSDTSIPLNFIRDYEIGKIIFTLLFKSKTYYTTNQLCNLLGIKRASISKARKKGQLIGAKIEGFNGVMHEEKDVIEYLKRMGKENLIPDLLALK